MNKMNAFPNNYQNMPKRMGRPKKQLVAEERARREIANSNERKRMQSINNGFQCLRRILKNQNCIEKQSKAAILHESAQYIHKLEQQISLIADQNILLKNFMNSKQNIHKSNTTTTAVNECDDTNESPLKRQRLSTQSDTGQSTTSLVSRCSSIDVCETETDYSSESLEKEVSELKSLLSRERNLRQSLEERQKGLDFTIKTNTASDGNSLKREYYSTSAYAKTTVSSQPTQHIDYSLFASKEKALDLKKANNFVNCLPNNTLLMSSEYPSYAQNVARPNTSSVFPGMVRPYPNFFSETTKAMERQENNMSSEKKFDLNETSIALPLNMSYIKATKDCVSSATALTAKCRDNNDINSNSSSGQSSSSLAGTGRKDNFEMILKAIKHISGENVLTTGDEAIDANIAFVKKLSEKFGFRSDCVLRNQYLRQLLSNESRVTLTGASDTSGPPIFSSSPAKSSSYSVESLL